LIGSGREYVEVVGVEKLMGREFCSDNFRCLGFLTQHAIANYANIYLLAGLIFPSKYQSCSISYLKKSASWGPHKWNMNISK